MAFKVKQIENMKIRNQSTHTDTHIRQGKRIVDDRFMKSIMQPRFQKWRAEKKTKIYNKYILEINDECFQIEKDSKEPNISLKLCTRRQILQN